MNAVLENIYFLVFGWALASSFFAPAVSIPGLRLLQALLICGMANEGLVLWLKYTGGDEDLPHHIYVPLEYLLLVLFYCRISPHSVICRTMKLSVPLYLLITVFIYQEKEMFSQFPSLTYLISSFLNVVWLVLLFFYFKPPGDFAITALPVFWILAAFLVFYAGVFCFIATYQYFLQHDRIIAAQTRSVINQSLNILLYVILSYAFLCSIRSIKVKSYL